MNRLLLMTVAMCATIGCSAASTESRSPQAQPASPDAFVGAWRSVTPTLEFIGLTVVSKSSQMGAFGARLTYSGVAFDGDGRIDGDSLVATMTVTGSATATGVMVAHARDARTLRVQVRNGAAAPLDLTFIRQD
jgi:hypothetical protein